MLHIFVAPAVDAAEFVSRFYDVVGLLVPPKRDFIVVNQRLEGGLDLNSGHVSRRQKHDAVKSFVKCHRFFENFF